jgi:predicted patatin/cPLA2 family phospholipase
MQGLVISGGGAFGALGAGTLTALNKSYQLVAGVSTGALMAPLVCLQKFALLKEAYTSVSQADIFNVNPFTGQGKINIPNAVWRVVRGKTTLGETENLKKTIRRFMVEEDYRLLQNSGKEVIVACQEISRFPSKVVYFSSRDTAYTDFLDWLWAAANAPVVSSILYKDGGEWIDAGLTELLSLQYLIRRGCTEIDVILHRPRRESMQHQPVKNIFNLVLRLFEIQREALENDDLAAGLLSAEIASAKINVYYMPRSLGNNSLIFDKNLMLEWYNLGYTTAFDESRIMRFDFTQPATV